MAENFSVRHMEKLGVQKTYEHLVKWSQWHLNLDKPCNECPFNNHGCSTAAIQTLEWFLNKIHPLVYDITPDPILIEKKEESDESIQNWKAKEEKD